MRKAIYLMILIATCGCRKPVQQIDTLALATAIITPSTATMVHDPCPVNTKFLTVFTDSPTLIDSSKLVVPMTISTRVYYFVCQSTVVSQPKASVVSLARRSECDKFPDERCVEQKTNDKPPY